MTTHTWANGFGVWHVRVSHDGATCVGESHSCGAVIAARRALRDELLARENNVARSVWMHPERVPELDTPDTLVYREGAATDDERNTVAVDRYKVNDALSALASDVGVTLDDDTLNELTHHVADVLDAASETP